MSNNITDLGKVGITLKGEWNNATSYERLDVVTYEGSSYVSKIDNNSNSNPSTSPTKWQLVAQHGEFTEQQLEDFKDAVVADSKEEMDDYTDDKKTELNTYTGAKKTELDTYEGTKETELNTYASGLKDTFNTNATNKTTAFNTNVTNKTTAFNNNASSKTTDFNTNASTKTENFNDNATAKTNTFNSNATDKTTAFNQNATEKTAEFDENAESIQDEIDAIDELIESELESATAVKGTTIDITDSTKWYGKLIPYGRTTQAQLSGKNKCGQIYSGYYAVASGSLTSDNHYRTFIAENLPAGEYIFSTNLTDCYLLRIWKDEANTNIAQQHGTYHFTTTTTGKVMICVRNENSTEISEEVWGQIEEGSTATDYEPYCGAIPSPNYAYIQNINNVEGTIEIKIANGTDSSAGGYELKTIEFPLASGQKLMEGDYLADDGIHHVKKQTILNITSITTNSQGYAAKAITLSDKIHQENYYLKCNKASVSNTGPNRIYDNAVNIVIVGDENDTLATMQEKYNGAIVEYALAEEVVEAYTSAQEKAFGELKRLMLYYGTNHIWTEINGLEPNLQLQYYKTNKSRLNSIEARLELLEG